MQFLIFQHLKGQSMLINVFLAIAHVFFYLSLSDIKKERPPTPDDVIVLSDNEPSSPCVNGVGYSFKKTDTEMLMVMWLLKTLYLQIICSWYNNASDLLFTY